MGAHLGPRKNHPLRSLTNACTKSFFRYFSSRATFRRAGRDVQQNAPSMVFLVALSKRKVTRCLAVHNPNPHFNLCRTTDNYSSLGWFYSSQDVTKHTPFAVLP